MQRPIHWILLSGSLFLSACGGGSSLTERNVGPVIGTIADQSVTANGTADVPFTVSDDRTAPANLQISAASDAPGLVGPAGLRLDGSGSARTLAITPEPDRVGSTVVTITATDAAGLSSSASFLLTVEPLAASFTSVFREAFVRDRTADPQPINHLQFVQDAEQAAFSDLL